MESKERVGVIIGAARSLSEQLGAISLYFNPSPVTFPAALKGVDLRAADADQTWNIYTWEL